MEFLRSPRNWVSGLGVAVLAFAVPHFVDDFLYRMPAEFGLTNPQAQILGGLFFGASAGFWCWRHAAGGPVTSGRSCSGRFCPPPQP